MGNTLFGLADPATATNGVSGSVLIESDQAILGSINFGEPGANRFMSSLPLFSTANAKRELFLDHVAIGTMTAGSISGDPVSRSSTPARPGTPISI